MALSEIDCSEALRKVEAYLDGELPLSEHAVIRVHLTDCSPCADRADFRRDLKAIVSRKCSGEEAPSGLKERLLRRLDEECGRETPSR